MSLLWRTIARLVANTAAAAATVAQKSALGAEHTGADGQKEAWRARHCALGAVGSRGTMAVLVYAASSKAWQNIAINYTRLTNFCYRYIWVLTMYFRVFLALFNGFVIF